MIQPQAYWQEFECPSSAHTAYVSGGLVVLVLYATIAVRMLVTGAGLAGVSLKINFFDWGHDEHHLARDRHVLSQNINRCVYVCVCVCVCVWCVRGVCAVPMASSWLCVPRQPQVLAHCRRAETGRCVRHDADVFR